MIQGKVWGTTTCLFQKNNVEIHRLIGNKRGFCSYHKHEHKWNMFFVETGKLKIVIEKAEGFQDVTELKAGQGCIIEPGHYHQFEVLESGVFFEIYWTELNPNDIIRADCGGVR